MSNLLRVGIVGCGEVAQIIHLPTLRELRDRFQVTALCDVSRNVLEGVGGEWGVAARFTDYRDLVRSRNVDVVLIANPHVLHAEVALAAMEAGKHVMLEKPMCVTLAEADALIAVEAKTGVTVQVGLMRRYAPAFTEAVTLVRQMSDIRLGRVHDVIGRNALIISQIANVIRPTDLPEADAARLRRLQSAKIAEAIGPASPAMESTYALMLGLSTHDLSAMRELRGMPKQVLFATARGPEGRDVAAAFDYGAFVCQFSTGGDQVPRFDAHIEVYSPSQVVRVDFNTPYVRNLPATLTVLDANGNRMARSTASFGWRDPFLIEWSAFHEHVTQRTTPKTSLVDAREDLVLSREMIKLMKSSRSA